MSKYEALIDALVALEAAENAEAVARSEVAKLFGGVGPKAERFEAPEHTVERVEAKVIPITEGSGLVQKVRDAAKAAGASLSEVDTAQLNKLEDVLNGLRGKSESEQVAALKELGVLAVAV